MDETTATPATPESKRPIWVRLIYMLLMGILFHLAEAVMWIVAVIQFVLALLSDRPNERLVAFGRSLGRYVGQIAAFMAFATEEVPFPFSDWPSGG
jgi:nucleoside recognition membrane protein YjiH